MSLYSTFQCDSCGKLEKMPFSYAPEPPLDWIVIQYKEQTQHEVRLNFCSKQCLHNWVVLEVGSIVEANL